MQRIYTIVEILDDGVVVKDKEGKIEKSAKIHIPKFARAGDLIRHCEHGFYDVIDENGDFIYRHLEG